LIPAYVPPYEAPSSAPELFARYPLAMISPPARNFLNSTFVNVDSLRATEGEPHLDIHPLDAAARGIANGAQVRAFNDRGSMQARARVTDRARQGLVVGLSIWWKKLAPDGKNANELTSQRLTTWGRAGVLRLPGRSGAGARGGAGIMIRWPARRRLASALAVLGAALLVAGCDTLGYYYQSIGGHLGVMAQAQPIDDAIATANGAHDARLAQRLTLAREIRDYASRELKLPDNGSYRRYANLHRPYVVWSVFATPELSMDLRKWCFPIVGCITYRGYYDQKAATTRWGCAVTGWRPMWPASPLFHAWLLRRSAAQHLRLPAEGELARLIFHELAHQVVYVRNDTAFNESFATAVETAGVERWLAQEGSPEVRASYQIYDKRRRQFRTMLLGARDLVELYHSPLDDDAKRQGAHLRRTAPDVCEPQEGRVGRLQRLRPMVRAAADQCPSGRCRHVSAMGAGFYRVAGAMRW
jgi:predicted aminopeptidase